MTGNSQRKLGNTQRPFQECSNIYRQVMRETPGSRDARRMAARQASAAHAGGGYTQKWSQLCDAKIVISICATAPTADNQAVASGNERRMLMVICQCNPALEGMWQGGPSALLQAVLHAQVSAVAKRVVPPWHPVVAPLRRASATWYVVPARLS